MLLSAEVELIAGLKHLGVGEMMSTKQEVTILQPNYFGNFDFVIAIWAVMPNQWANLSGGF